uniref:Terminase small subunit n=1 Tax=Dinoroseobacter phage vB_DshS_R26L TaxID=3161158 RepID=A0AAU7VFW6_9CAUD
MEPRRIVAHDAANLKGNDMSDDNGNSDNVFDFSAFLERAANPGAEETQAYLNEAVRGEMDAVMNEVAPRLWCIAQEQMARDPRSDVHLNAVLNSLIFATLAWVAAITPARGPSGTDNDQLLRDKIMSSLDTALQHSRADGKEMSYVAHNVGRLKLTEDALKGTSRVLMQNSHALTMVAAAIKDAKK